MCLSLCSHQLSFPFVLRILIFRTRLVWRVTWWRWWVFLCWLWLHNLLFLRWRCSGSWFFLLLCWLLTVGFGDVCSGGPCKALSYRSCHSRINFILWTLTSLIVLGLLLGGYSFCFCSCVLGWWNFKRTSAQRFLDLCGILSAQSFFFGSVASCVSGSGAAFFFGFVASCVSGSGAASSNLLDWTALFRGVLLGCAAAGPFASDSLTALVPPAAANPFASGELPGTVVASESGAGRNRENVTPIWLVWYI